MNSRIVAVVVDEHDAVERGLGELAIAAFGVGEKLFGALAFGDVPKDALHADDVALGIVDRRLDDLHIDGAPVRQMMGFDGLERFVFCQDAAVVLDILGRQPGRKQVEIGLAEKSRQATV